jgi:hypothetical protein
MSGYLQRLLDTTTPAADPPALTPVAKSTSPIFEQNQLPGLAGLYGGAGEAEVAPQPGDAPGVRAARALTPPPPATAAAVPSLEITRHDPLPATQAPSPVAVVGRPVAEDPPTPLWATIDAASPLLQEPPDTALEPMRPDPEIIEPSPRLETLLVVESERAADTPAMLMPLEAVFAPAASERVATGAAPATGPGATSQPEEAEELSVIRDAPLDGGPIDPVPDVPLRPGVLEPRPRPDFDGADPDADEPRPEPQHAPRITIGRVTVALVPDPAPAARAVRAPRTAETASMIGPLGNRRARQRLFALARL